jgi:5-methylcytosine-specific restriction enzyme subunit McrC
MTHDMTLEYNRKTIAYKEAINLARLIILNFAPSIKSGDYPVLGILFDMNKLFEEFVYMRLKKSEVLFHTLGLKISSQTRRLFWASKTIRPDILLEISKPSSKKVIMDTKWKMLSTPYPTDDDLKQMYTYNLQFGAAESVLLYPKKDFSSQSPQLFFSAEACPDYRHHCRLYFIDMFDGEGKIKKNLGIMILSDVLHCYPN